MFFFKTGECPSLCPSYQCTTGSVAAAWHNEVQCCWGGGEMGGVFLQEFGPVNTWDPNGNANQTQTQKPARQLTWQEAPGRCLP